jgi:hypothetical protein
MGKIQRQKSEARIRGKNKQELARIESITNIHMSVRAVPARISAATSPSEMGQTSEHDIARLWVYISLFELFTG